MCRNNLGIAFLLVVVARCFGGGATLASDFTLSDKTCDKDAQGMTPYGEGIQ
jgi:hypothetical protein